ncbi:MAG: FUN14 domain-containing protein [Planctomycetota bacterium]|nr:FUN14 domain-containing protein [Planctomycetota bacterium]MDA0934734.1 FUN14 domain-containing protein [Planctomycetota bacterium]
MDEAPQTEASGLRANLATLAAWKKALLAFASLLVVAGAAWMPFEQGERSELARTEGEVSDSAEDDDPIARLSDAGSSLLPGGPILPRPGSSGQEPDESGAGGDETLSPALLQMGFSFFAAFAVGLAFRSFLKVALVFVGMQLLALFGLSYVDWITVHWDTMSDAFDRFVAGARGEFESFQAFVTGSLPQVGLASLGLVAGFKR